MIIAIDFDGTCVTHKFPEIGDDIGAVPVLRDLVIQGHQLILYTMRSNRYKKSDTGDRNILDLTGLFLSKAVDWFKNNNIPLYGINLNPTQFNWSTSPKCYAELYIDDAALGCPLIYPENGDRPYVNWVEVRKELERRKILCELIPSE